MAAPSKTNSPLSLAFIVGLAWLAQACASTPQGMTDYQRAQLQLQQQHQAMEEAIRIRNSNNQMINSLTQLMTSTPEYGVDPNQTQCVTGLDSLGRIVTRCSQ